MPETSDQIVFRQGNRKQRKFKNKQKQQQSTTSSDSESSPLSIESSPFILKRVEITSIKPFTPTREYSVILNDEKAKNINLINEPVDSIMTCEPVILSSATNKTAFRADEGFISTVLAAFDNHRPLVIRPDDLWQAIMSQLSCYLNDSHDGLQINIVQNYGLFGMRTDFDETQLTSQVEEWMVPEFSTTVKADRVTAAVTALGRPLNNYDFKFYAPYGAIPKVTLLGSLEDYRKLRMKTNRLLQFSGLKKWYSMLSRIIDQCINLVSGKVDHDFWRKIVIDKQGSISGWLTVFSVFKQDGEWQGNLKQKASSTFSFLEEEESHQWPIIERSDISRAQTIIPVLINGNQNGTLMAGQFSFEDQSVHGLSTRTDWCLAEDNYDLNHIRISDLALQ